MHGIGGGVGETVSAIPGTVIQALPGFPVSTPVLRYHDVAHTYTDGVNVDCQSITGCIAILYDSDNSPPSSLNTWFDMTLTGFHQGVVVGLPGNTVTAPASCSGNPNQSGCYQMDTDNFININMYGNGSDATAEGYHVNSSNAMQNGRIERGNIQAVNKAVNVLSTNGTFSIQDLNAGSPQGTTPIFILFGTNVAQSGDLYRNESEGGGWTGGAVVDHSCNPLGTNGSPTWIGNAFNGNNVTVDGCEQITDIGSNNSASSTFTCAGTAQVVSVNTSKWAQSGSCILSTFNLGALRTQQVAINNANGFQFCTGFTYVTCGNLTNDTNGGAVLTSNGGFGWQFQNAGVSQFPGGINAVEVACQGRNSALDELCPNSTAHAMQLSNNNGVFYNVAQVIPATSSAFATATTAGTCVQNTTSVPGALTSMAVVVSPVSTPGVGAVYSGFVSSSGNVTITECAVAASAGGTIAFNIRAIP